MQDIYDLDADGVDFIPRTAKDAVRMFNRTTKGWSIAHYDRSPELLIKCAKALSGVELDNFEQWVMNPKFEVPEATIPEVEHIDPKLCFPAK